MKRYVKSAAIAPYMNIPKKLPTPEQKEMRRKTTKTNQALAWDMLENLSDAKKVQLDKFLSRNEALTSTYGCAFGDLRIYKEGWYLTLDGTRSQFSVWYFDNDGDLVEGRKPNENKLSFLYEQDLNFNGLGEDDWRNFTEGVQGVTSATDMDVDPQTGWPGSGWWLSSRRIGDPEVVDILEPIEDPVLNELGVYIVKYVDEMSLLDKRDDYEINSMDWDDYIDEELKLAASCRSSKEFQGKFRKWMWDLMDKD